MFTDLYREEKMEEGDSGGQEGKGHPKHSNINKMKRERNTQKVKEQNKCTPSQTKEEEIRNLPDKEF